MKKIPILPKLTGTLKKNGVIQRRVFGAAYNWFYIRPDEILEALVQVVKAVICLIVAIALIRLPLLFGVPKDSIFLSLWILFSFFASVVNMNKLYKKLERNPYFLIKYLKIKNRLAWWSTMFLAEVKGDPFIEELQANSPFLEENKDNN